MIRTLSIRERARIYSQELADLRNRKLDLELKLLNPEYRKPITDWEVSIQDIIPEAPSIFELELV